MRYAIIENEKVVNVIEADSILSSNQILSYTANIGDEYINKKFIKPLFKVVKDHKVFDRTTVKLTRIDR